MKSYFDGGKFAAPRWLMYPELSATTIGWRMGYGESYWMSIPFETDEFRKLLENKKSIKKGENRY